MKKIVALTGAHGLAALGIVALGLAACSHEIVAPTPEEMVSKFLTRGGLHVLSVNELYDYNSSYSMPVALCSTAASAVDFRAVQATDGHTVIGVACVEKDNSITIALERVL